MESMDTDRFPVLRPPAFPSLPPSGSTRAKTRSFHILKPGTDPDRLQLSAFCRVTCIFLLPTSIPPSPTSTFLTQEHVWSHGHIPDWHLSLCSGDGPVQAAAGTRLVGPPLRAGCCLPSIPQSGIYQRDKTHPSILPPILVETAKWLVNSAIPTASTLFPTCAPAFQHHESGA